MSGGEPEWVAVRAAARLNMSPAWVRSLVDDGVEIRRRGNQPGVNWTSVEAYIQRCRIAGRVNDTLLR